jgi:PAS domain S-box-containing protein
MSSTLAQFQFAAEFVTLMVAAAGLALAVLRPDASRASGRRSLHRWSSGLGFLTAGTVAFLHGSLLVTGDPGGGFAIARLVAAGLLVVSVSGWAASPGSRWAYGLGVAVWAAAAVAELLQAPDHWVDGLLVVGGAAIGVALLAASGRSVAMRVAAGAATTLLLVILVLAVALSSVISSSVQRDELKQLSARAQTEAQQVQDTATNSLVTARFVAADLKRAFAGSAPDPLQQFASAPTATVASDIFGQLNGLQGYDSSYGFAYANPAGTGLVVTDNVDPALAHALLTKPTLSSPACSSNGAGSVFGVDGEAWAAATFAVCLSTAGPTDAVGTVLTVYALDHQYLAAQARNDPSVSLALVGSSGALAQTGPQPGSASLATMATRTGSTAAHGDQFLAAVSAQPGSGSASTGPGAVAVVVSTPATSVLSTRTSLYRTLFLIALGGTVLALGLAAFTGDRITFRLRRLTDVAARIESGSRSERAGFTGQDEVARLGSAFDSMVDAVEDQAAALRDAADDETRLRNRLEAVVAGMNDALVAVDASGLVTDFNRAAEELFGVSAAAARGRSVASVVQVVGEDGTTLAERLARAGTEPWAGLGGVWRNGGDPIPVGVSAGALRGPAGELAGRVVVVRDLRREHEVEQMKTEFLSRIGHELRTPLTGIMGYSEILLRRDIPIERARAWYDEILQAGRRLLRIIEMLEFFASSGAGRVLLRPEAMDTRALINGITGSWTERVPANITLRRRVARHTPPMAADRRWLSLAIDELIDNAVKFSPDGGLIVVGAGPAEGDNGNRVEGVEITVTDHGVGMSADRNAEVWSDFVQGDGSDTRRFGGLGLGLAVVRRVVEGHGGQVRSRSAEGRGTTFTIVLPAAAAPVPSPTVGGPQP